MELITIVLILVAISIVGYVAKIKLFNAANTKVTTFVSDVNLDAVKYEVAKVEKEVVEIAKKVKSKVASKKTKTAKSPK
jgi:hypothetical protein